MILILEALAGFLVAHCFLAILWSVRHDGQSGMCCPFVGCVVFVATPWLMWHLYHTSSTGLVEGVCRLILLAVGVSVFLHLAIQMLATLLEERRNAAKSSPSADTEEERQSR